MINAIAKLFGSAPAGKIDTLARQVVELSLESVCQLVGTSVDAMSFSEARGYIRARAGRIVRRHAQLAIGRTPDAHVEWIDDVARIATERLVPQVLRQTGVGVLKVAQPLRLAA